MTKVINLSRGRPNHGLKALVGLLLISMVLLLPLGLYLLWRANQEYIYSLGKKGEEQVYTYKDEKGNTRPKVPEVTYAYRESGSFVKFLIEKYGLPRLKKALGSVKWSDNAATISQQLMEIYGLPFTELEEEWVSTQ